MKQRSAFTLIELLVVMAIISILIGLLMPAVQSAREAANRTQCANNLKQIGLAMHLYHHQHDTLPFSRRTLMEGQSWAWMILPYLEQQALFNQWPANFALPGLAPGKSVTQDVINQTQLLLSTPTAQYFCPSSRPVGALTKPFPQDVV